MRREPMIWASLAASACKQPELDARRGTDSNLDPDVVDGALAGRFAKRLVLLLTALEQVE